MTRGRDRTEGDGGLDRRTALALGAGALAGLAGCFGGQEAGPPDAPTDSPTGTPGPTATPEAALTEPVPVPEDARCAVCNMGAAEYPDWNAQLATERGHRAHFCSPGCLVAYEASPETFEEAYAADERTGVWARDHGSRDLIDATAAEWVLELNADRVDAPMMRNPLPFASGDDAGAYVDRYDDLTGHDRVGFDAFDLSLAAVFRGRLLPEPDGPASVEPAPVPEDAECAVCGMRPAKFPDWNAQLSFEDDGRAHLCSPGCQVAFYADPGHFEAGRSQEAVVGTWARDYESGGLVDEVTAHYVLETDADRIDAPMGKNPVVFATREAAVAYVERYDDLSAEDVVPITAFDLALAKQYRGKFL